LGIIFPTIEELCIGSTQERGGRARGVELIAGGQVIFFSLFPAPLGANCGAGIDKIFEGAIGADHSADIAALHNEGSGKAEFPLEVDEVLAEFGYCGNGGDGSIHFGQASVGAEVTFSLTERNFLAFDLCVEINFFQKLLHASTRAGVMTRLKGKKSESTIHSACVDVDVLKIVGHEAGDGAFA